MKVPARTASGRGVEATDGPKARSALIISGRMVTVPVNCTFRGHYVHYLGR